MAILNDNQLNAVSGGAAHANGQYWSDGGATYYRIAPNDFLGNIAQLFGTTPSLRHHPLCHPAAQPRRHQEHRRHPRRRRDPRPLSINTGTGSLCAPR